MGAFAVSTGTVGLPSLTTCPVGPMVTSEGPYALMKRRPGAQAATTSGVQASPAEMTVRSSGRAAGSSKRSTVGGRVMLVMCPACNARVRSSGDSTVSARARCSAAPEVNAMKISDTEASKVYEANWYTRSAGVTSNRVTCACTRLTSPLCWSITPLGTPVDPEV